MSTVLYAVLNEKYGDEWLYWDPSTVYLELREDYICEPASEAMDRISAVQVLMTGDGYFTRLDAFLGLCNTFTSGSPAFNIFNPVTVAEAAWGLAEASFMREFLPFSPGIRAYLKVTLETEGYFGDHPDIFDEVLGPRKDGADLVRGDVIGTLHEEARNDVEQFLHDQLEALVYQFGELEMGEQLMSILKEKDRSALV
jgi:hypothetical protein